MQFMREVKSRVGGFRSQREIDMIGEYWDQDSIVQAIWAHRSYVAAGTITTPNAGKMETYYPTDEVNGHIVSYNRNRAELMRHVSRRPQFIERATAMRQQLAAPASYTRPRRGLTREQYLARAAALDPSRALLANPEFIRQWVDHVTQTRRPKTLVDVLNELGCDDFHIQFDARVQVWYVFAARQYHQPAIEAYDAARMPGVQVEYSDYDGAARALAYQIANDAKEKTKLQQELYAPRSGYGKSADTTIECMKEQLTARNNELLLARAQLNAANAALDAVNALVDELDGCLHPDSALRSVLQEHGIH